MSGPMQSVLWDQVISRCVTKPNAGWFVKAAESVGKSRERFFLLNDTRIDYFTTSGLSGMGKEHHGSIPIAGNTIALPHG